MPSQKYEPQLFPTVSRCTFNKKMGLRGKFFFAKKWRIDNFGMITPGRSRLFPTVSVSLERQLDLWTTDSTKITTFNTFPHDPSARRFLEMMHFDFETQYTLKIPKPQDLVKFNRIYQGKSWIYNIYNPIYTWIYSWCIVVCICTSWFMIHWRVACFYWSEIGFIVGYSPFMIRRKWNKQEWFPRTWKLHQ